MSHKHQYKNAGRDSQELRRRREEEGIQLRKQKREEQMSKRRFVNVPDVISDDDGSMQVSGSKERVSYKINIRKTIFKVLFPQEVFFCNEYN